MAARVILGSYMVRYPLGGMMSWVLQWLVGLQRLGHEITFVEKAGYPNSCYDPLKDVMSDDCTYGTAVLRSLLSRFGLEDRWCFVDAADRYHGMSRKAIEETFRGADVFIDMGTHGAWLPEASSCSARVLVDGEPGFTQMKQALALAEGRQLDRYDLYFTTGQNIGSPSNPVPTAGRAWKHVFHPVVPELFEAARNDERAADGPVTTVMNWQSYGELEYGGVTYGHKDREFVKFIDLPTLVDAEMEIAVSGANVPTARLGDAGWLVKDAHAVTMSFDSFREYIFSSAAEFSVCKNGYVQSSSGWFSDRSAAYLAAGRPVIMQDTGFSAHLPCGVGLLAVDDVGEAAEAIREVRLDYGTHVEAARAIASEYLDARKVLRAMLEQVGVASPT